MHILIVNNTRIPVTTYGGTERVIWYLGKELTDLGHKVTYLVNQGSHCPFADVLFLDPAKPMAAQIPDDVDVVHFNIMPPAEGIGKPYIYTLHGNHTNPEPLDINTTFVSRNHASRYNSASFVHNGMDWNDYGPVQLDNKRNYFHFLGNAAWRVKNVKGAIKVISGVKGGKLKVLGGNRLNIKMGFRLTLNPNIQFHGMVGGAEKLRLLQGSKGLVFPVRWHEPFGLAITESLYFGCPVLGTPYGSLPELVPAEVGFLSNNSRDLTEAARTIDKYSRKRCHEYAADLFNSRLMAERYLEKYATVLNGQTLNQEKPQLQQVQTVKFLEWH
ncbi:glycosyltransferase family 4 protein [Pontibacter sp. Tf4]|uniref:glycosyltransferase family 4 protein n=1 Tax=Pontibacter sp. Tf4 TaxID=2761620 RepID=UPI0016291290|nr:glycosyltransferase family 4 protein [Pontibacter sp. Tf4]MBB6612738.1 glycosyltransferase family 4 protein [Pontibacter sp. Tf4]